MAVAQAVPHGVVREVGHPRADPAAGANPGLDISIRTGSGQGSTLLSAFDAALQRAGVADFNLVTLSSVIPTGSRIRTVDAQLPGGHGDLLFCVRAEAFADQPGQTAWAGLGWCVDGSGGGLFVEHHGESEDAVVDQITRSLGDMNAKRGGGYGRVDIAVASARCVDLPVCALVLAAYRVSSWHDAEPQPVAAPQPTSRFGPAPVRTPSTTSSTTPGTMPADLGGPTADTPGPDRARGVVGSAGHPPRAAHGPSLTGLADRIADRVDDAPHPARSNGTIPSGWVRPDPSRVRVTVEKEVDYATALRYHDLYRATFGALETTAVARQLLHEEEFLAEMLDPRVHKYVAWNEDDQAIGMSTLTSDLDTVPWISPGYFAHRYPEQTARGAVFYMGFTLVDPAHRGSRTFHAMFKPMIEVITAVRGVVAWDMCLVNEERGLLANGGRLLKEHATVTIEPIDRQTYYAATFHGPPVAAPQT